MKKSGILAIVTIALLLAGCDTFQFTKKSVCLECLKEARSRAGLIAGTLLKSSNPTVSMEGEVLVIGAKDELLKVSCSGDSGCVISTTRKKADGTMSDPHQASLKEVDYLYCPKTLKKYNTAAE